MKSRRGLSIILAFLFITACQPRQSAESGTWQQVITPEQTGISESTPRPTQEYSIQSFARLSRDAVLLQLEFEPTFSAPGEGFPFGRVPEFTLLADGRVLYQKVNLAERTLMTAQLSPDETGALLQEILDLGLSDLEDYADTCMPQEDGTSLCVEDAAYSIIRQRMPNNSLKEVAVLRKFLQSA